MEAFLLHVDGCGVATATAAAINIIGALATELLHATAEYFRVEPIEVGGTINVVLGKLGGAAHIEQHGGGVGPHGLNKRLRLQRQDRRLGRATAAKRQGGKEGEKYVFHDSNVKRKPKAHALDNRKSKHYFP